MSAKASPLYVRVTSVEDQAKDIRSYRLEALDGMLLPAFKAGAHIGVIMPTRITRYYSLCSSPYERQSYTIAVQNAVNGRGGSKLMHEKIRPGMMLKLYPPRNFFALVPATSYTLIAGGIGITPLLAMIHELEANNANYRLIYCVKDRDHLPFADRILQLAQQGRAVVHMDDRDGPIFDFQSNLASHHPSEHLYCCGSTGFMLAVKKAAQHWPAQNLHFEAFTPVTANPDDFGFELTAARSGKAMFVEPDQSVLDTLRQNGVYVESVCENGTCGTCRTRYLKGTPDHRDQVLTSAEKANEIMVCVSRIAVRGETLVLDV